MTEQLQRHQQQIKELINEIKKMVLISENDIKTLVYWAIATHAHEDLDRLRKMKIRFQPFYAADVHAKRHSNGKEKK